MTTVVEEGRAADVVLEAAKEHDASFIVIGCQGWGRLEKLRLGSVSKKVAARTDRPLVLVPTQDQA